MGEKAGDNAAYAFTAFGGACWQGIGFDAIHIWECAIEKGVAALGGEGDELSEGD